MDRRDIAWEEVCSLDNLDCDRDNGRSVDRRERAKSRSREGKSERNVSCVRRGELRKRYSCREKSARARS